MSNDFDNNCRGLNSRNYDSNPKPFARQVIGETLYTYPQRDDNPTPLYEELVATLPFVSCSCDDARLIIQELMAYRDHTFPPDTNPIPTSAQITQYLHSYAERFGLHQYIRSSTRVDRLYRGKSRRWAIDSFGPGGEASEEFDFISVTNGHYSDPWTPAIPGIS